MKARLGIATPGQINQIRGKPMATDGQKLQRIPTIRNSRDRATVDGNLGFLAELVGTWEGEGFNLIARPDKEGGSPLFLELNQTFETLSSFPSPPRYRTVATSLTTSNCLD
jgi:hypothetical protein